MTVRPQCCVSTYGDAHCVHLSSANCTDDQRAATENTDDQKIVNRKAVDIGEQEGPQMLLKAYEKLTNPVIKAMRMRLQQSRHTMGFGPHSGLDISKKLKKGLNDCILFLPMDNCPLLLDLKQIAALQTHIRIEKSPSPIRQDITELNSSGSLIEVSGCMSICLIGKVMCSSGCFAGHKGYLWSTVSGKSQWCKVKGVVTVAIICCTVQ